MMTLNHGLSGYVMARAALPLLRRVSGLPPHWLAGALFVGAMLPDADILTRAIAGRWAYFGTAWYGHRQLSHSLLGTLLLGLLAAAVFLWVKGPGLRWVRPAQRKHIHCAESPAARVRQYLWLAGAFWLGGMVHMVGDVGTPGRAMPVFWPLDTRIGAWSHIGWYSPYLSWLFLTTLALDVLLRFSTRIGPGWRVWATRGTWALYLLAGWRWLHFLGTSRYEGYAQWEAYQLSLLPEPLVSWPALWVHTAWHWLSR